MVRLGEYDVTTDKDCDELKTICAEPVLDVGIDKTIIHPKYNPSAINRAYDIALLRLNQTITYTG